MKYYELKQIATYLSGFKKIFALERVDDTIIKFLFDKQKPIFVDLKRGGSTFFMCDEYVKHKVYNAPFDVLLTKNFARSSLQKVEVLENNRILRLHVKSQSHYKDKDVILQLEFTGKNTNAIILDDEGIVLEALRHIDSRVSFREVSVGEKLLDLPSREFKEDEKNIEDIPTYLHEIYLKKEQNALAILKANRHGIINKKLKRLKKELEKLPNEEELGEKSIRLNENGSIILANLLSIKPYLKRVTIKDFEGNDRVIEFPKEAKSPQHGANMLYLASKKLKQKSSSIHIERESLEAKIEFYERLDKMLLHAKSSDEVQIIVPKQQNRVKRDKVETSFESFFVQGYKIMVGKSEKSNISLLKVAKKSDIWLHIKEIPSSHVIIRTNKQNLPQSVLEFGAKLCVNFSTTKKGSYLVDYTMWKHVRIDSGANVFYTHYKTIKINCM